MVRNTAARSFRACSHSVLFGGVIASGVGSVAGCAQERELNDAFVPQGVSAGTGANGMDPGGGGINPGVDSRADDPGGGGGGIKLDLGDPGGGFGCGPDTGCGCNAVDVLFVIDNSASMGSYQQALGLAFPAFAGTLTQALPPGTSVHVGVTSTEMGYSSQGRSQSFNGACSFVGDGGQSNEAFYVTPDSSNSGVNGAQGRLYEPSGGQSFFAFNTGEGSEGAEAWFTEAVRVGEGGSNIEMLTAPVGWAVDSANDATNGGFLRDVGSVFAVFFVQDENDQTPNTIEGKPGGQWVLDQVLTAKRGCGGLNCVVAGGMLNEDGCSADGNLPIDDFLDGLPTTPAVMAIPDASDPQALADQMNDLLSNTLAELISSTCEEIIPEG